MEVYYTNKFVKENGLPKPNDTFTLNQIIFILNNIRLLFEKEIPFRFNGKDLYIGKE